MMHFTQNETDDAIILILQGDLDLPSIKHFKESSFEIAKQSDKNLILDFSEVTYIDSSGIGILLTLNKIKKEMGKSLRIINCTERIAKIFALSSLSDIIESK
jgi:anti-anti-sigma factor